MLKLAAVFGNGMILQRQKEVFVWGKDDQAKIVEAYLEDKKYTSEVKDGKFLIGLPPHEAATGLMLTVKGSSEAVISDVCFGDVFYLAGQSNMELPVSRTLDVSNEEVANSNYPLIRQYRVTPQFNMEENEIADLADNAWTDATPEKIGFSACRPAMISQVRSLEPSFTNSTRLRVEIFPCAVRSCSFSLRRFEVSGSTASSL